MSILEEARALQKPKKVREIDVFHAALSPADQDDFITLLAHTDVHATTICKIAADKGWGKIHPDIVRRARTEGWSPA